MVVSHAKVAEKTMKVINLIADFEELLRQPRISLSSFQSQLRQLTSFASSSDYETEHNDFFALYDATCSSIPSLQRTADNLSNNLSTTLQKLPPLIFTSFEPWFCMFYKRFVLYYLPHSFIGSVLMSPTTSALSRNRKLSPSKSPPFYLFK